MVKWLWRLFWIGWGFTADSFWVRIGGFGVQGKHRNLAPMFSEREGVRPFWPSYPARWRFRHLTPFDMF